jgi:hypothetical protein
MKRLLCVLVLSGVLLLSQSSAKAQVHVNVNIGAQPLWGPVGYDVAEYYYLPDLQMYYYVPRHQFIYLNNGNWVFANGLPARYHSYDLYSGYKVVINEPKPYLHFNNHRAEYAKYKGWKGKQVVIRDSREPKYFVVKGHPGNKGGKIKTQGKSKGGNGHGGGHGKGNKH